MTTIRSYAEMQAAFRQIAHERGLTREAIDSAAGFPDNYASKLLAPEQIKAIGPKSLGPLLTALGVVIVIQDDPKAERITLDSKRRRNAGLSMPALKRQRKRAHHNKGNSKWGQRTHAFYILKVSRIKRSRIARLAAKARWEKRT